MTESHVGTPTPTRTRFVEVGGAQSQSQSPPTFVMPKFKFLLWALARRPTRQIRRNQEVMWFQGLTAFLQPPKVVAPRDRTAF